MSEEAAKVCPYCEGKGYVSVVVEIPANGDPNEGLSRTTWVRKSCPLCNGRGRIFGDYNRNEGAISTDT